MHSVPSTLGIFAVLSAVCILWKLTYAYFFDPLRRIPRPKLNAISRIPYTRHLLKGTTVNSVVELHRKYGEVVRLSPNEVSFTSVETAWTDIYGFRTGKLKGHLNMPKDPVWYPPAVNGAPSILLANDEDHSRGRKLLSYAFSDKALAEQESLIQSYADQLVERLKEVTTKTGAPVDMTKWYSWTTFDIIADLLFSEPFGCLQELSTHQYVELLIQAIGVSHFSYILAYFPAVKYFGNLIIHRRIMMKRYDYLAWISTQVKKRMERETDRVDSMTYILAHNGDKGIEMSKDQLDSNASLSIGAGLDAAATLLSGATYLLLKNPDKLKKLKREIRGRFKEYSDMTLTEVNLAPYLNAVLHESLRYFPPVPTGFEREVPKGGDIVSGYFLPEGTSVAVFQYPANHSESNFKNAEAFAPERWLGDPGYEHDKRTSMQPFSYGPRNCLGKNLAYAEMRLITAKMIWSFDMALDHQSEKWLKGCRVYMSWQKPELAVILTQVQRS